MTNVRRAVPADATAIASIHVDAWQWAYQGLVPQAHLDGMRVEPVADFWLGQLSDPQPTASAVVVSVADDQVRGFVAAGSCRDADRNGRIHGELYALYVAPSEIGQGHGRALVRGGVAQLAPEVLSVSVWVLEENGRGRGFYGAMGFTPEGALEQVTLGGAHLSELRYVADRQSLE